MESLTKGGVPGSSHRPSPPGPPANPAPRSCVATEKSFAILLAIYRNYPNICTMAESLELLCVWAVMVGLIGLSPVFWAVIGLFR